MSDDRPSSAPSSIPPPETERTSPTDRPPPPGASPTEPPGAHASQPPPAGAGRNTRPPPEGRRADEERSPFERILPELIKRGLEASRGTIGNVSDTLFSRDLANSVVNQLGEVREGLVSAVAQEVGRFLRQADIAAEIRNVLTGMEVEANIKIKFRKAEDGGGITTDVEVEDPPKRRRWRS